MKKKRDKAQSGVISTVLLILLVVAVSVIIFGFVIPFVKEKLSEGDCLDVSGKVELDSGFTCYNEDVAIPANSNMQVQIHVGDIADLLSGFAIELGGATSTTVRITEDIAEFTMYGGEEFSLPGNNEARTYIILSSEKPKSVKIYPILESGKTCPSSDSMVDIDDCI